ncbi:MAG TPA: MarC family protein [Rhizomicrobium sp.]|nr:MarC family protein [Rhizomicrobium sp.]
MGYESANYVFAILFVTLGPLKVIPVFHALTHDAHPTWRRQLAFRAFLVATIIVAFIAFCVIEILATWRVSVNALVIAGGILLFLSAAEKILKFELVELPTKGSTSAAPRPPLPQPAPGWMSKPVLQPLVIPAIVTPTAVVAILFFLAQAQDNAVLYQTILALLALILAIDFVCMIAAGIIMRVVGLPALQVVGWILSVVQAGLAVQIVIAAAKSAGLA